MQGLPFTTEEFYGVFARYNTAVWPFQVVLFLLALACVAAIAFRNGTSSGVTWILALLWAWMGVAYHFAYFTAINPAAWAFGALSLGSAAVFAWHAARAKLAFRWNAGWRGVTGAALVGYALVGYPVLGQMLGARYPQVPTFGLPCPTTIFTLGILLFAVRPAPRIVFALPILWALIGSSAAFALGVPQDLGLLVAVAAVTPAVVRAHTPSSDSTVPSANESRA